MKSGVKLVWVALGLLLISGCEKDFILPEEEGDSKMTVNCLLNNDNNVQVFVTGKGPLVHSINDAVVELRINDSETHILPFVLNDSSDVFGSYRWNRKPVEGNKYSLKVTHPQFGIATAEDVYTRMPQVISYQLIDSGDAAGLRPGRFRLVFQDNGAEENYYRLNVFHKGEHLFLQNTDTVLEPYYYSSRPQMLTELTDTCREWGYSILFSDKNFNGQSKEIAFEFEALDLSYVSQGEFYVILADVSKAHYSYYKTLEQYRTSQRGEFVSVFSNIQNGYGILMSQCVYWMAVRVK